MAAANVANAQGTSSSSSTFSNLGSGLVSGICSFITSPIIIFVCAAAIIGVGIMFLLGETKGVMKDVIRVAIGIAIITGVGALCNAFGLSNTLNC